jgi:two-component system response regulator HupR/HoxA
MHDVCRLIGKAAASDITVLVRGETGTGKELVARAIHSESARSASRFLVQNAGALPDSLLESELFGHRRGAFSGAVEHRVGLFEAADGGTVLLDEIGEASQALQVRLLRFLETGCFRRIGETRDRCVDVRIIAATNRDLEAEVAAGRFREDLYYRLSVLPIVVPPLRERKEDIPVLVHHFVNQLNQTLGRSVTRIPERTMHALVERDWRGNVRELRSIVQRLMVLSSGDELQVDSLGDSAPLGLDPAVPASDPSHQAGAGRPDPGGAPSPPTEPSAPEDGSQDGKPPSLRTLEEVEREHIAYVLDACGGNQTEAARRLGLNRSTFRWRLRKLGLLG